MQESRTARTHRLLKASIRVLRDEPRLWAFPAVAASINVAIGALSFALSDAQFGGSRHARQVFVIAGVIASYPVTFASLFCGVALASVLGRRLDGNPATASDGWRAARERLGVIATWTLIVCTVGAVLRLLEEYVPLGGKIVAFLADLSWSLATVFIVPVLAYERLGPRATLRRSIELVRARWAEQVVGTVGIGIGSGIVLIPFATLVVVGVATAGTTGVIHVAAGGAGVLGVTAIQVALDQVFRVFVYRNATGIEDTHVPFPKADLDQPFRPRKGLLGKA